MTTGRARPTSPAVAGIAVFVAAALLGRGGLLSHSHPGDVFHYQSFATRLVDGLFPYGAGFYLEYPPFSLPPFVAPELLSHAHYLDVFKVLMAVCGAVTVAVVAATLDVLGVARRLQYLALAPVALAPLLVGPAFLNRYDPWAALLTALALLALLRGHPSAGASLLAIAIAAKTYPAAAIPVAAVWILHHGGRRQLLRSAGVFVLTCAAVYGPFLVRAFGGLGNSYYTQARRSLEIESTGAAILLVADKAGLYSAHWFLGLSIDLQGRTADAVGAVTTVVEVAAILAVSWLFFRSRRDAQALVNAFAATVLAFVAFNKVFSPQYVMWLVPLAALAAARLQKLTAPLVAAILLMTNASTIWGDQGLRDGNWSVWLLSARDLAVLLLLAVFVRELAVPHNYNPA